MSSKLNALVAALEAIDNKELEITVTEAERNLRSAVSRATVEQNITVAEPRKVPITAALKVVDRYISENLAAEDPRDWMFFAAREVAHFLDYAQSGTHSDIAAKYTDLLPVGHPDSTNSALSFMSDPAVIRASAAWFASDDRIAPEAYDAVFNAFATIPGTTDHQFATARLRALPAGLVPSELVIKPIVAAFGIGNPFAGGNSSAARSARARAQRRDSKGRFAEMGGGARFSGLFDGFGQSVTGKIAGVPQNSNDIEIEVLNHPRLPNGIYPINANGVEGVKAVLRRTDRSGKEVSIPVTDRRALANAVPEADLLATRKDAPTGWNKNPDGSYTSDDGYSVSMADGMQTDSRFQGGGVNGAYDPSLPVYKLADENGETVAFTQGWADIQKAAAKNDESTGKSPVKARLRKIGEGLPPISELRKSARSSLAKGTARDKKGRWQGKATPAEGFDQKDNGTFVKVNKPTEDGFDQSAGRVIKVPAEQIAAGEKAAEGTSFERGHRVDNGVRTPTNEWSTESDDGSGAAIVSIEFDTSAKKWQVFSANLDGLPGTHPSGVKSVGYTGQLIEDFDSADEAFKFAEENKESLLEAEAEEAISNLRSDIEDVIRSGNSDQIDSLKNLSEVNSHDELMQYVDEALEGLVSDEVDGVIRNKDRAELESMRDQDKYESQLDRIQEALDELDDEEALDELLGEEDGFDQSAADPYEGLTPEDAGKLWADRHIDGSDGDALATDENPYDIEAEYGSLSAAEIAEGYKNVGEPDFDSLKEYSPEQNAAFAKAVTDRLREQSDAFNKYIDDRLTKGSPRTESQENRLDELNRVEKEDAIRDFLADNAKALGLPTAQEKFRKKYDEGGFAQGGGDPYAGMSPAEAGRKWADEHYLDTRDPDSFSDIRDDYTGTAAETQENYSAGSFDSLNGYSAEEDKEFGDAVTARLEEHNGLMAAQKEEWSTDPDRYEGYGGDDQYDESGAWDQDDADADILKNAEQDYFDSLEKSLKSQGGFAQEAGEDEELRSDLDDAIGRATNDTESAIESLQSEADDEETTEERRAEIEDEIETLENDLAGFEEAASNRDYSALENYQYGALDEAYNDAMEAFSFAGNREERAGDVDYAKSNMDNAVEMMDDMSFYRLDNALMEGLSNVEGFDKEEQELFQHADDKMAELIDNIFTTVNDVDPEDSLDTERTNLEEIMSDSNWSGWHKEAKKLLAEIDRKEGAGESLRDGFGQAAGDDRPFVNPSEFTTLSNWSVDKNGDLVFGTPGGKTKVDLQVGSDDVSDEGVPNRVTSAEFIQDGKYIGSATLSGEFEDNLRNYLDIKKQQRTYPQSDEDRDRLSQESIEAYAELMSDLDEISGAFTNNRLVKNVEDDADFQYMIDPDKNDNYGEIEGGPTGRGDDMTWTIGMDDEVTITRQRDENGKAEYIVQRSGEVYPATRWEPAEYDTVYEGVFDNIQDALEDGKSRTGDEGYGADEYYDQWGFDQAAGEDKLPEWEPDAKAFNDAVNELEKFNLGFGKEGDPDSRTFTSSDGRVKVNVTEGSFWDDGDEDKLASIRDYIDYSVEVDGQSVPTTTRASVIKAIAQGLDPNRAEKEQTISQMKKKRFAEMEAKDAQYEVDRKEAVKQLDTKNLLSDSDSPAIGDLLNSLESFGSIAEGDGYSASSYFDYDNGQANWYLEFDDGTSFEGTLPLDSEDGINMSREDMQSEINAEIESALSQIHYQKKRESRNESGFAQAPGSVDIDHASDPKNWSGDKYTSPDGRLKIAFNSDGDVDDEGRGVDLSTLDATYDGKKIDPEALKDILPDVKSGLDTDNPMSGVDSRKRDLKRAIEDIMDTVDKGYFEGEGFNQKPARNEAVENAIESGDLDQISEALNDPANSADYGRLQDAYYDSEGEYLAEQFEGGFGQAAPGGAMDDPATDAQYNFVKSVLDQQGSSLPADLRDAMEEADNNRNLTKGEMGAIIGEMNKNIDKTRPSDKQLASIRRNVIAKGLPKKEADKIIKDLAKMKKDDASKLLDRLKGMEDTGDFRDASPSIIAKGDGFEVKYTPRGDGKWDATPVDREGGDIGATQVIDSPEKDFADNYAGLSAADFPGASDGEPAGFAQSAGDDDSAVDDAFERAVQLLEPSGSDDDFRKRESLSEDIGSPEVIKDALKDARRGDTTQAKDLLAYESTREAYGPLLEKAITGAELDKTYSDYLDKYNEEIMDEYPSSGAYRDSIQAEDDRNSMETDLEELRALEEAGDIAGIRATKAEFEESYKQAEVEFRTGQAFDDAIKRLQSKTGKLEGSEWKKDYFSYDNGYGVVEVEPTDDGKWLASHQYNYMDRFGDDFPYDEGSQTFDSKEEALKYANEKANYYDGPEAYGDAEENRDETVGGYTLDGFDQRSASMPEYLEEDFSRIKLRKTVGANNWKYQGADGSMGSITTESRPDSKGKMRDVSVVTLTDKDGNVVAEKEMPLGDVAPNAAKASDWLKRRIADYNTAQNKEATGGLSAKQMEPATPAQYDMLQEQFDEREFDANTAQAIEEALANKNLTKAQMSTLIGQGNDASFKPGIDATKPSDRQIKSLTNKLLTKDIDAAERDQFLSDLPGMSRDEVEALNNRLRSKKDIPGTAGFAQEAGDKEGGLEPIELTPEQMDAMAEEYAKYDIPNLTESLNDRLNKYKNSTESFNMILDDELSDAYNFSNKYKSVQESLTLADTARELARSVRKEDSNLANDLDSYAEAVEMGIVSEFGPVEAARAYDGIDTPAYDPEDIRQAIEDHVGNYFSTDADLIAERLESNDYYGDNRTGGAEGSIQPAADGKYEAIYSDSDDEGKSLGVFDTNYEAAEALAGEIANFNEKYSPEGTRLRYYADGGLEELLKRPDFADTNAPKLSEVAEGLEEVNQLLSGTRGGGEMADHAGNWASAIRERYGNSPLGFDQEAGTETKPLSPKMGEPATDAQYGYIEELVGNKAGITTDLRQAVLDALEAKNLTKAQMGAIIGQLRALEFNPDFDPTKPTKRQINRAKDLAAALNLSPKERRELGLTRLNSMSPDEIGKLIDKLKRRGERGDSGEGSGGVRPKAPTRPRGGPGRGANQDGFAQGTPKERSVTPQSISRILANAGVTKSASYKAGRKRQGYRASEGFQVQTDSDGNVTVNYRQRMGSDIPYSRFNETTRLPALDKIKNALEEKGFVLTEKEEGGFKVTRIGDAFDQSVLDLPRVSETVDSPKAAEKIASDAIDSNKKAEADLLGRIKDIIRAGAGSWVPNFDVRRGETRDDDVVTSNSAPINPISGHAYSASNFFALAAAGNERGYSDRRWMTYLQVEKAGAKIRSGEQGLKILTPVEREVKYRDPKTGETKSRAVIEMREQYVFNAEQMDGLGPDTAPKSNGLTAGEALDLFLMRFAEADAKRGGAGMPRINIGGGSGPRWIPGPSGESIRMPDRSMFESPEGFVQSLMHEIIHASGFESRLGRVSNTRGLRGDKRQIALEELSAELGSAILMQRMGVPYDIKKHAAYVDSHIRAEGLSEEDVNFAFAEAQLAADYALGNDVLPRWENLSTDFTKAPMGYRPKAPRSWSSASEFSPSEAPSAYPPGSPGSDENPMAAFAQAAAKKFEGKATKDSQSALEKVTEQLLEKIKTGAVPWRKPFKGIAGANIQRNPASKHVYTGINQHVLSIMQMIRGYSDPRWMTYKQAETMGGQVRKGEKAAYILVPMRVNTEDAKTGEESSFVMFKAAAVFNVEQIDGLELPTIESEGSKLNDLTPLESHEFLVERYEKAMTARTGSPVKIMYRDMSELDSPHWSPSLDRIVLPNKGQFNSPEELFDTLTHEMVHSTGHGDRLDRTELGKDYGKSDGVARAKEELIAEIGSALLADMFGVDSSFDNTAAYVQSWLQRLKSHPEEVIQASKEAQKAVDYILGTDLGDWSPLEGYGPGLGVVPKKEEKENG